MPKDVNPISPPRWGFFYTLLVIMSLYVWMIKALAGLNSFRPNRFEKPVRSHAGSQTMAPGYPHNINNLEILIILPFIVYLD